MMFPKEIVSFLTSHKVANLSYYDGKVPQACALYFAYDNKSQLIFVSESKTRHAQVLSKYPTIAFTINKDDQNWSEIQGLQGRGRCVQIIDQNARDEALKHYVDKYPFISNNEALIGVINKSEVWAIIPNWIRLIDNSKGFGYKKEWNFNTPEFP